MTMTNDREATCAERIADHLASRAEDVRKMLNAQGGEPICKHCGEVIFEAVSTRTGLWLHEDNNDLCDRADFSGSTVAEPDEDYHEDSLYEFGLGVSRKVVLRFDMSTGGPADWLEITCDEERHDDARVRFGADMYRTLIVERVVYHFADWFDHAEQTVDEDSPLWQLAEWVAETNGAE